MAIGLVELSVAFGLYFDEDSVNRALIRALRARRMDVANAIGAGHAGSPDRVQLEHATAEGRVLFTYNVGDPCAALGAAASQDRPRAAEGIGR